MFCSQLCSDEFSQQQFKMVKKKDSKMPAFFKALSFSGGLKKLRSIMAEPDETTIFDYDWTEANGGEEQLNLLRCLLSLQKKSVLTHQALKMAKDCLDPTKGSRNAISLIKLSASVLAHRWTQPNFARTWKSPSRQRHPALRLSVQSLVRCKRHDGGSGWKVHFRRSQIHPSWRTTLR